VKKIETQSSGSTVVRNATSMLIQNVLSGNTHTSSQGGFTRILNTLTLLLWSTRQRIIVHRHAILVVSLATTWPLNVLILTAVLSSTGKDGNAFSHYYINANDYQPSCIICEKDRDPKLWFYRCDSSRMCSREIPIWDHLWLNTLTLLLWSTRQRIMQHAILVVSLAMTWPLNVLILTAILSSTIKDGNALSRYGSWIAVVGFFLIFGLWLLAVARQRIIISVSIFAYEITFFLSVFFIFWTIKDAISLRLSLKVVCCFCLPS